MYKNTVNLILASALSAVTLSAIAEEEAPRVWEASAELGWLLTGGNTDTNSLNAKLRYSRVVNKITYSSRFETIRTEESDVETANKYLLEGGLKTELSKKSYLYVNLLHEDDEFSQYDFQTTLTGGYGRTVIQDDKYKLDLTAGPGYRYSKFVTEIDGEDAEKEGVVQLGAVFKAEFTKTSKFDQVFTIDAGEESTISKSESSITSQIANQLAMKASLSFRHNSDPLPGDANTDRETGVTLVYTW